MKKKAKISKIGNNQEQVVETKSSKIEVVDLSNVKNAAIVRELGCNDQDTGSSEVQVGILTKRITYLTEHFKKHPKDRHSKVGMMKLISRRKKLLAYMKKQSEQRYLDFISVVGLRK